MRRIGGWLLVIHGLAHAALGTWASARGPDWLVTPLWTAAMLGLIAGGFGLLGVYGLRARWEQLAIGGTMASLLLLLLYGRSVLLVGMVVDVVFLTAGLRAGESAIAAGLLRRRAWPAFDHPARSAWGMAASAFAFAFLIYAAAVVLARPWLVETETRGAFLHRDTIARIVGDSNAFGARSTDETTSRPHGRQHGRGKPSLLGVALGPLQVLVLEPAYALSEQ